MSSHTQNSPTQLKNRSRLLLIEQYWWTQSFLTFNSTLSFSNLKALNMKPPKRVSEREKQILKATAGSR